MARLPKVNHGANQLNDETTKRLAQRLECMFILDNLLTLRSFRMHRRLSKINSGVYGRCIKIKSIPFQTNLLSSKDACKTSGGVLDANQV